MSFGLPSWMTAAEPTGLTPQLLSAHVTSKRNLAAGIVELVIEPEKALKWEPGAHIDVQVPNGQMRQYSLCGDPDDSQRLRIAVLREADGRGGSRFLHDHMDEGDSLTISAPRNHFPLVDADRYLFIAGGIGVTPLLSMLNRVRAIGADWEFIYCGRSRETMAYLDELADEARTRVVAGDREGRLDIRKILHESRVGTAVMCCGPERMINAVEEATSHWPSRSVHTERFKARLDDRPKRGFEAVLARAGLRLRVSADQSLLDVLNETGILVPSSCAEGTCGTCETRVLEGEPEHRDAVLSAEERAAGDCMMVCVSRARGNRIVIDL